MIFKKKYNFVFITFFVIISCKKIDNIETQSSIKTFDAYLPQDHNINQNGFFFIDKNLDTSKNNYVTLFGLDFNCNLKFKKSIAVKSLIQDHDNYSNSKINKLLVDDKLLIVGEAYRNDTLVGFVSEIDQNNGTLISTNIFSFNLYVDTNSLFRPSDCDIVKTSTGYLLFNLNYSPGLIGGHINIKKLDESFNIIESKLTPLSQLDSLSTQPIVSNWDNITNQTLTSWYEYDYIGAIVTPDDELIVNYWGIDLVSPKFISLI